MGKLRVIMASHRNAGTGSGTGTGTGSGADLMRLDEPNASSFLRPIPEDSDDGSSAVLFPRFSLLRRGGNNGGAVGAEDDDARSSTRGAIVDTGSSSLDNLRPGRGRGNAGGPRSASIVTDKATIELPVQPPGGRGPEQRRSPRRLPRWGDLTRRTKWVLCFSVGLTLLVILAIVLVVILTDATSSSTTPSPTVSPAPSILPTMSPSTVQAVDEMLYNVSDPSTFADPTSPQSLARAWLLDDDLILYDVIAEGESFVQQRYACAELIYALNPSQANVTLLVDQSECDWPGFDCDDGLAHVVTVINLTSSNLAGSLPEEVSILKKLKKLILSDNAIVGSIPSKWLDDGVLPYLYYLDLSNNSLTGILDSRIWTNFPFLSYLYLSDNRLSGTLAEPSDIHTITPPIVEEIFLSNNTFTGPFPSWIFDHYPLLEKLLMAENQLTGTLPQDGIVWPTNLTFLDVGSNRLSGRIPSSLFFSPLMEKVYLNNNTLSGPLPDVVTLPTGVTTFASPMRKVWLHANQLTGTFPALFGSLWSALEVLTLHDNAFMGTLSSTLCGVWTNLSDLTADCPPNSTDLSCACCTECF